MNTKERIMDASLELFSKRGYDAVSVSNIADMVGIKAPSIYKHYESKYAILNAIVEKMQRQYEQKTAQLMIHGMDSKKDIAIYEKISEEQLIQTVSTLFSFFLHDSYISRFRKMLMLEQFHNSELSQIFSKQYFDDPLMYQTALFQGMHLGNMSDVVAMEFYAPIYMLLVLCDRQPQRENEAMERLTKHVQFFYRSLEALK